MPRPRQRCLALLPLLMVAAYGTGAVTLSRRDSLELLDAGWKEEDGYYVNSDGLSCQKCPKGYYLAEECKEQNGSGRCEPCRDGEYMEYPNALPYCRECSKCREDQVEQSPCRHDRNTVCACKNGSFCPPEHPCEMCQKCQPRCPEGQEVLKPCSPNSDLRCGPATDTNLHYSKVIAGVLVTVLLFGLGIAFVYWRCHCRSPGDGTPSSRSPYETVRSMFQKLPWYRRVDTQGAEDNAANEHRQRQQRPPEPPVVPLCGSPRRRLVPAPGQDRILALRGYFYTFARKVPKDEWKKFGRSLDLEENDIVTTRLDDDFYEMLLKWQNRKGFEASVNTLLDTLDRLQLGGVAEDIASTMLQDGVFQYEKS